MKMKAFFFAGTEKGYFISFLSAAVDFLVIFVLEADTIFSIKWVFIAYSVQSSYDFFLHILCKVWNIQVLPLCLLV